MLFPLAFKVRQSRSNMHWADAPLIQNHVTTQQEEIVKALVTAGVRAWISWLSLLSWDIWLGLFCSMFASWDSLPLSAAFTTFTWHSFPGCCNFLQLAKTSRFSYYSGDYKIQELTVKAPTKFSPLFSESIFFRPSVLNKFRPHIIVIVMEFTQETSTTNLWLIDLKRETLDTPAKCL